VITARSIRERPGGRGGGPAAPATRRIYLSMVRALAREGSEIEKRLREHVELRREP
jgi:hypothetical protein